MDSVAGAAVRWNIDALKEPRGFIKFIEFIIAIFAFATTTSSKSSSKFSVECHEELTKKSEYSLSWSYPFRIDHSPINFKFCNDTEGVAHAYGDFGAPSQFFVFVGVMSFLYCIGAVILYVCFDDLYRKLDKIPMFDFIATCAFVLMWLISSSAWAAGVSDIKLYTDPEEYSVHVPVCMGNTTCTTVSNGNFASLNVSIIFGFLNMAVWGGNLWFLYKETKWFKVTTEHPERTEPSPTGTPSQI